MLCLITIPILRRLYIYFSRSLQHKPKRSTRPRRRMSVWSLLYKDRQNSHKDRNLKGLFFENGGINDKSLGSQGMAQENVKEVTDEAIFKRTRNIR